MTEPVVDPAGPTAVRRSRFALPPADDPNRRIAIIGLVGVSLLLLFLVATRLLGGGGGGEEEAAVPPPAPPVETTTTIAPAVGGGVLESFDVFRTKNPFTPLAGPIGSGLATTPSGSGSGSTPVPSSTGAGVGAFTGRATTTTTAGSGSGSGSGTGSGSGSGSSGSGGGGTTATTTRRAEGNTEPRQGQRVALLDVFTEGGRVTANVRVNSTVHKVHSGETFAGNYRVLSLSAGEACGRFVFGDDQFRLCEGEETLK
ncbi:MAG TPA: hypothetical protein VM030_09895 [Acidimicrobiales bacterium]|nr:hypothetical protein [Acidimicrobiales bacterium]